MKRDCPEEETQLTSLHDAVIASLRHQVDEMQQTLEFLRTSDHSLRLSLRDSEQRTHEAEVKFTKATERCLRTTYSQLHCLSYVYGGGGEGVCLCLLIHTTVVMFDT